MMNKDKCQALFLGEWTQEEIDSIGIPKVQMMTITGLVIGDPALQDEIDKANFKPMINNMKNTIKAWKARQISSAARITAHKAQGLAQFQHLAMATMVPEPIISEVAKLT